MTTRRILLIILWLALLLTLSLFVTWEVAALPHQPNTSVDLTWNTLSASGGSAVSASYNMEATLGQPIVDRGTSATTHLSAGFWQTANTGVYRVFMPILLK